jgi:hypothetical protein
VVLTTLLNRTLFVIPKLSTSSYPSGGHECMAFQAAPDVNNYYYYYYPFGDEPGLFRMYGMTGCTAVFIVVRTPIICLLVGADFF